MLRLNSFLLVTAVMAICACSSKYVAKDVESKMDVRGNVDGAEIGLDGKKQIIIQKQATIEAELKQQQFRNYELERKLTASRDELNQCRTELADSRLGGSGKVTEIPDVDQMKTAGDVKEETGITENGELKVVKREFYADRLASERRYEQTMSDMLRTVTKFNQTCQREMGFARVKAGLPSERYQPIGHFAPDGKWALERKGEKTLDDAFEIRDRSSASTK